MFGNKKKLSAERQELVEEFVRAAGGNRSDALAYLDKLAATVQKRTKAEGHVLDMFHFATTVLVTLDESENDPRAAQEELVMTYEAGLLARVAGLPFKKFYPFDFLNMVMTSVRTTFRPALDKRYWEQSLEVTEARLRNGLREGLTSTEVEELTKHRDELEALLAEHYPD